MSRPLLGTSDKVLEIDLSSGKSDIYHVAPKERRMFLGGKGLGLKLLADRLQVDTHALAPENILGIMPGVLLGTGAPCSGRFHALAKSPLTGIISSSSCGGPFGLQLKTAGWDGLLITGRAREPSILYLDEQGLEIRQANHLWGLTTSEAQAALLQDKQQACLVIGPAGENQVPLANIASGERFLGRGGLGAVLGAKNIKAVVAQGGTYQIKPVQAREFAATKKKALQYIQRNPLLSFSYRKFGTRFLVNPNNAAGILPVSNFQRGRHDQAWKIAGETFNQVHETSYKTCKPCSILCGQQGNFAGQLLPVPEYETVALLGSNLQIFDRQLLAELNRLCSEMGLDTMSTGGTLAWAMEAGQKGIFETSLRFGQTQGLLETIKDIAHLRGQGRELARGCRSLADQYGGQEFAMHIKGLELAGYDPRGCQGQGLGYAVANRGGCHLSAYLVAMEVHLNLLNPGTTRAKARFVRFLESLTNCVNSLQTCQFTMFAYTLESPLSRYTPRPLLKMLMQYLPLLAVPLIDFSLYTRLWSSVTGIKISNRDFLRAGDRIQVLERYMNTQMGITQKDDQLPSRCLTEDAEKNILRLSRSDLETMLQEYYKLRGYDARGVPLQETLRKLGLI